MKGFFAVAAAMAVVITAARAPAERKAKPVISPSAPFPGTVVGNIEKRPLREPSGIVYHPARGTLFVVGDEGEIEEIRTDGSVLKETRIRRADFEGITCDPATGLLYIADEGTGAILEVDPDDFTVRREFPVAPSFRGSAVIGKGRNGIEGITFLPDPAHPEGGNFFLTNQAFFLTGEGAPSAICEVRAPLRSAGKPGGAATVIGHYPLRVTDLSGIHYDNGSGLLYVVSDINNAFLKVTRKGEIVAIERLPGEDQEGLAIDAGGNFYIAQDSGGIIKIKQEGRRTPRVPTRGDLLEEYQTPP